ncbi:MAG TPA: hypothetical protein VMR73_02045 [Candidatus Paceibacterota bacterium]|nr:hypothetical protein [Candidatus Paceibacterota bacterium]
MAENSVCYYLKVLFARSTAKAFALEAVDMGMPTMRAVFAFRKADLFKVFSAYFLVMEVSGKLYNGLEVRIHTDYTTGSEKGSQLCFILCVWITILSIIAVYTCTKSRCYDSNNFMDPFLLAVIVVLMGVIGYFLKQIFDRVFSIGTDVSEMKPKLEILWKDKFAPANSPRQLNTRGESILNTSGIKQVIDEKKDHLLKLVRDKKPASPYDAETAIEEVMNALPTHCPDVVERLKQGAFSSGVDVSAVLFAGSIYLRNLIFTDLGFSLEDLDKPKTP